MKPHARPGWGKGGRGGVATGLLTAASDAREGEVLSLTHVTIAA